MGNENPTASSRSVRSHRLVVRGEGWEELLEQGVGRGVAAAASTAASAAAKVAGGAEKFNFFLFNICGKMFV